MRKIIFIVLGHLSNGELTITLEFANRLPKDSYEITFIVPKMKNSVLNGLDYNVLSLQKINSREENRECFIRFIKKIDPCALFISDVYTLEYSSNWSGIDMEMLKSLGKPLIALDEYEYPSTEYRLDFYGGTIVSYPNLFSQCGYLIRNCPLNIPRKDLYDEFCFSLYTDTYKRDDKQKTLIRKNEKIFKDQKVIFFTSSKWESINTSLSRYTNNFVRCLPQILCNYINEVAPDILLIHVSPLSWDTSKYQFNYRYYNFLPLQQFNELLSISDLFITVNMASVTLTKAVYSRVPCIVFENPKRIFFPNFKTKISTYPLWYQKMAAELEVAMPFKASVFGWNHFLKTVIKDNQYLETFSSVPLYKYSTAKEALYKALFDQEFRKKMIKRQHSFCNIMATLPEPDQIIRKILASELKRSQNGF